MIAYIVRRTLLAVLTLLVISFFSYVIVQIPTGDIVDQWHTMRTAGRGEPGFDERRARELREELGLFEPIVVQWWNWVVPIFTRGDFGMSYTETIGSSSIGVRITPLIQERLPYTIYLSIFTVIITWIFAVPVGIYSAVRVHSVGDYLFTFAGFLGLAVPDFLLGLILLYVAFAYFDHSVGGIFSGDYLNAPWSLGRVVDMMSHLAIPAIVLGTSGTAGLIRIMRNNLLDELGKPYVVTARAKGLPNWRLIVKYPLRMAINPFISGIGSMLPGLVSGSAIVSIVLSLPTLGPVLLKATLSQDGQLTAALVLMFAVLTVVGTLISDLMLVLVDPRIKLTGSARGGGGGA